MTAPKNDLESTKHLMAALGRLPPKQHKDMKLGKGKRKIGQESQSSPTIFKEQKCRNRMTLF
jgi:hypothetical protein